MSLRTPGPILAPHPPALVISVRRTGLFSDMFKYSYIKILQKIHMIYLSKYSIHYNIGIGSTNIKNNDI